MQHRSLLSPQQRVRLSKFLALVLRHQPDQAGIKLDERGAVDIEELADALRDTPGWEFVRPQHLIEVARSCERGRFQIDERDDTIRASYGHSFAQPVVYDPAEPPDKLYVGMVPADVEATRWSGLRPVGRQYVHLSTTARLAHEVGSRHADEPAVLVIDAAAAHKDGIEFYRATDEIWLAREVPGQYIQEYQMPKAEPERYLADELDEADEEDEHEFGKGIREEDEDKP
jgi:putative RNA 2'-phosphotransferase